MGSDSISQGMTARDRGIVSSIPDPGADDHSKLFEFCAPIIDLPTINEERCVSAGASSSSTSVERQQSFSKGSKSLPCRSRFHSISELDTGSPSDLDMGSDFASDAMNEFAETANDLQETAIRQAVENASAQNGKRHTVIVNGQRFRTKYPQRTIDAVVMKKLADQSHREIHRTTGVPLSMISHITQFLGLGTASHQTVDTREYSTNVDSERLRIAHEMLLQNRKLDEIQQASGLSRSLLVRLRREADHTIRRKTVEVGGYEYPTRYAPEVIETMHRHLEAERSHAEAGRASGLSTARVNSLVKRRRILMSGELLPSWPNAFKRGRAARRRLSGAGMLNASKQEPLR